jgi:hypothetical protein
MAPPPLDSTHAPASGLATESAKSRKTNLANPETAEQDYYERRYQRRVVSTLMRRAHVLGYTLVKNEDLRRASSPP